MKIKFLAATLVFVLATTITLPVFAGDPQTLEIMKGYRGDDAAIRACIERLNQ